MSMHDHLEAASWVGSVVRFEDGVLDDEVELEPGMIGHIVECQDMQDGVWKVLIDVRAFDDINEPLMTPDFFDSGQVPCLTAKEAGFWKSPILYFLEAPSTWRRAMTPLGKTDAPMHIRKAEIMFTAISLYESDRSAFEATKGEHIAAETRATLRGIAGL